MLNQNNNSENMPTSETVQALVNIEPTKVVKIEILHLVKEAQQQHGLRHGDYQRYRGYCTRRIRRLRKTLNFRQADKKHFKRREVTLTQLIGKGADKRFIYIPLFSAERAWAYAMQLKPEANTEPRKRFHLINKLKKASKHALFLQELCNSNIFDARTKLECEAYVAWMHGSLHFETQLWKTAGEYLKRAEVIYENLAEALPDDEQELYRAKINEFAPNLRFCAYNISGSGATTDDLLEMRAQGLLEDLDALVNQTKTENAEGHQTIDWRGRKVTVRPEKVNFFLLSVQELDRSLEKVSKVGDKIQLIERTLIDCKDTIQTVKDEIRQDPKLRSLGTGQPAPGVQYLLAYLSYIRHSRTLQRNLFLIDEAKDTFDDPNRKTELVKDGKRVRPQDLARLYEIILQNVYEMQQINAMEDNAAYQLEVQQLALAFRAFRCYYIALTLIDIRKWKEAVALYERASNYATEALNGDHSLEIKITEQLKGLVSTIDGCKFSAHAYSVLENDNPNDSLYVTKSSKSPKPLYERISQYKEDQSLNSKNPNVFKMIPEMEAIPGKPLFFDLALNHVNFPPLDVKLQSASKKGISGFVKGFLGWSDNM